MQEIICEIPCQSIRVSPFQTRRLFSDEELEELGNSIREIGLIHPPVVREVMSNGKILYYELIAGERRWRATQRLGKTTIKVLIRPANDEEAARATLIENLQRVDLNPMEAAAAFKKLVDAFRMTQEEVGEKVGKKRSTIANYLRLFALPESIQNSLSKGEITMGHAKALLSLEQTEHQITLANSIIQEKLSVRAAEIKSRLLSSKSPLKKAAIAEDPHIREIEERLSLQIGSKAAISHKKDGSGTLTLHYYNLDDLDKLLAIFSASFEF